VNVVAAKIKLAYEMDINLLSCLLIFIRKLCEQRYVMLIRHLYVSYS